MGFCFKIRNKIKISIRVIGSHLHRVQSPLPQKKIKSPSVTLLLTLDALLSIFLPAATCLLEWKFHQDTTLFQTIDRFSCRAKPRSPFFYLSALVLVQGVGVSGFLSLVPGLLEMDHHVCCSIPCIVICLAASMTWTTGCQQQASVSVMLCLTPNSKRTLSLYLRHY